LHRENELSGQDKIQNAKGIAAIYEDVGVNQFDAITYLKRLHNESRPTMSLAQDSSLKQTEKASEARKENLNITPEFMRASNQYL